MSEIVATAVLIFALLFMGANQFAEGLNPLVVGALIISIGLSLGGTTGFAINPARDLGPRLAHFLLPIAGKGSSDWGYAWIPVIGPLAGGLLGAWLYQVLYGS
jgi:glycerol uptake facilitator protein